MSGFFSKLRARLQKIFFWHERGKRSTELTPPHAHDRALVLHTSEPKRVPRLRQLRYAGLVFSAKEQRILFGAIIVFILAVIAGAWAIASDRLVHVPANGGRITEALVGSPKYINPLYAQANDPDADLTALVFAGLFRRTNGTTVVPDLVERYEWSDNAKRLTLTLRNELTFHDGTRLTSDDVLFTLRAAKTPEWRSTYTNAFRDATFERIDDRTIAVVLKEPDIYILDALTIGILPAHIWQDIAPANALLAEANVRPIGAGPFTIYSFRRNPNGSILNYTLTRFEGYHGIKPFLEQIELRFYPDRSLAEEALRGGQVDVFAFVPSSNLIKLTKNEQLKYATLELPQQSIAFFNVNDAVLKDANVRQALELAIDRKEVVEAQAGISHPVSGPYPFMEAEDAATSTEELLERARKLLDKAGWTAPEGGEVRTKKTGTSTEEGVSEFSLTLTVPDVPDLIAVADVLERRWSLLGANVTLSVEDPNALIARIPRDRDAQILVWNVLLNPSQDLFPIWWSGEAASGLNLSNLKDRDVDDAIEAIRSATTTEALKVARKAVSEAVLARHPAVFLTRPAYGYVHTKKIKGVSDVIQIGTPSDRFQDVLNWYVKSQWKWK